MYSQKCAYLRDQIHLSSDDIVVALNPHFSAWDEYLEEYIRAPRPKPPGGKRYTEGEDRILWHQCNEHLSELQQQKEGNCTVIITHPFYPHLTDRHRIRGHHRHETNQYLDRLLDFLDLTKEQGSTHVVAVETLHHYAAATSLLVEDGLIDHVIFSEYNSGNPINTQQLARYGSDAVFFAGGCNGCCLTQSIHHMRPYMQPEGERIREPTGACPEEDLGRIWGIRELTLNTPGQKRLHPAHVYGIEASRMLGLDELIPLLGLER